MLTLAVGLSLQLVSPIQAQFSDDEILARVLTQSFEDGGFTVVSPESTASHLEEYDAEILAKIERRLEAAIPGADVGPLLLELKDRKRETQRIHLASSPDDGYVFDHDGSFATYFEQGGGGWPAFYEENPLARGYTRVSLPAVDEEAGLVLIYVGTRRGSLSGVGYLYLYRWKDGELEELTKNMMWIS